MATQELTQLIPGSVKKATTGISSGDLWKMPIDRIKIIPGFNVREKDADYKTNVRKYADSMKANGYDETKPMAGYVFEQDGEHYIGLTDGHTRFDSVALANKEGAEIVTVPVVTKARGTSMEDITVALVTSNSGAPLKPLEVAKVCKRLVGYGMEVKDIATRLTLTAAYVNQLLDLLAAPKALREMVATGTVSATLAMETVKKHGKEATKVLSAGTKAAKKAGKERVTAKHVKAATAPKKAVAAPATPQPVESSTPTATPKHISDIENLLELGAEWIRNNAGGASHRAMLAFLAGVTEGEVAALFETATESDEL